MALVSVNIVNYKGKSYLKSCLDSVLNQSYKDFEVLFIDNDSQDGSLEFVRENYPRIGVIQNKQNLGYAKAHNQGIRDSKGEYILCLNPDVILDKDYIKNALAVFESKNRVGAVTGKLLRWDLTKNKKADIIDNVGLMLFKNHRIIDRGQGEKDRGQYDRNEEVFGVSGAAPMYLRKALEDVKSEFRIQNSEFRSEYFDENFFSYKEDIDLSWRLRLRGWKCFYTPKALGWHARRARGAQGDLEVAKGRKEKSEEINYCSYKNHLIVLLKNETLSNLARYFSWIFWYELKKFSYILFFEPKTLRALFKFFVQFPLTLRKRKTIMARRIVSDKEIRKWIK